MKKIILVVCVFFYNFSIGDTTINISKDQLQLAESAAKAETATAAKIAKGIKKINIQIDQKQLDIQKDLANQAIADAKQHSIQSPTEFKTGEKYYINSPVFRSDAINQAKINQINARNGKPVINFNDTLKYYNQLAYNTKNVIGNNHLLIFVSNSIPKAVFQRLIKDGAAVNAVFVFRGMINHSMKDTQKAFMTLKSGYNVGAEINPKLFKAFNIQSVPAFVVYKNNGKDIIAQSCDVAPEFAKITGDVTVRYALEQLRTSKSDDLSMLASNYLDRLDSKSYYNNLKGSNK